jgi:hypothetical protein
VPLDAPRILARQGSDASLSNLVEAKDRDSMLVAVFLERLHQIETSMMLLAAALLGHAVDLGRYLLADSVSHRGLPRSNSELESSRRENCRIHLPGID